MTLLFAPNLSMLWTDLPLADRFEAAARAGFGAVELWWPGNDAAATLPGLTSRWKLWLALLNFDGGDLAAGERGLTWLHSSPRQLPGRWRVRPSRSSRASGTPGTRR